MPHIDIVTSPGERQTELGLQHPCNFSATGWHRAPRLLRLQRRLSTPCSAGALQGVEGRSAAAAVRGVPDGSVEAQVASICDALVASVHSHSLSRSPIPNQYLASAPGKAERARGKAQRARGKVERARGKAERGVARRKERVAARGEAERARGKAERVCDCVCRQTVWAGLWWRWARWWGPRAPWRAGGCVRPGEHRVAQGSVVAPRRACVISVGVGQARSQQPTHQHGLVRIRAGVECQGLRAQASEPSSAQRV